ncbi:MAG: wax ester/triacylglycerol synthase family O-acyltransferase [Halieaceae bacterium]|jgi:WS/DGAT/MGAT family acyltransferase|nr:wax ester/triacylglycerol synthase family O-acyltransferase [Halieaceae bacterium]
MKQLTGPDAMFLHMELEGFPMQIGGVSIYDQSTSPGGLVRFKDILAMFESRLDRSPIFRRKLVEVPFNLDQPYWVDDPNFDLEFHVRHIALPKPGDWRQLCIQVARLHARPLDRNRPLWEAYIIEGLHDLEGVPPGSFALYLKVHHAAMDGASGVEFFGAFNDTIPNPEPASAPALWQPSAPPGTGKLLFKAYTNSLLKPGQMLRMARDLLSSRKRIKQGLSRGEFSELGEIPTTRFNRKLTPHRVVGATRFDFDAIRSIKNSVQGATVNDVMLAIVSGALRKYLIEKNELPEGSLVTGCPVNVRDEGEKDKAGNMVGMMTTALCTDVDDPLQRLREVHEQAVNAKAYMQAQGARMMVDFSETVPAGIQALLIQATAMTGLAEKNLMMNTTITNVPGAPYQLYMCGAQLIDSFGIGPLAPGMGLFHTVNSMVMKNRGAITLAFICCREVMPDPEFYTRCIEESFAELQRASTPRRKKSAKGKR